MIKKRLADRIHSFGYAFQGLGYLFRKTPNAQIHGVAAVCAIIFGILLHISTSEWIAVILCIGTVIAAEAFNSSIESLADKVSIERHPLIKHCKDLAAGGVLILAIAALVIGLIIFLPKIISLITG